MTDSTTGYRAIQPIMVGGVLAYNVGDPVPAENVEAHEYVVGEQVEQVELPAEDDVDVTQAPAPTLIPEANPAPDEPDAPVEPAASKRRTNPPA
jgi:hypothetical protein